MEAEIRTVVDDATKKAKADTEIGVHELTTDIYAQNVEGLIRNMLPNEPLPHGSLGKGVNL